MWANAGLGWKELSLAPKLSYELLPFCSKQQATLYLQWRLDWLEVLSVCFNLLLFS